MAETRPLSFRVDVAILDALEAAGTSAVEVSRAALEREPRLVRVEAALGRLKGRPTRLTLAKGAVDAVHEGRDSR